MPEVTRAGVRICEVVLVFGFAEAALSPEELFVKSLRWEVKLWQKDNTDRH